MPFASLWDVRRALHFSDVQPTRDIELAAALEAAEDWVRARTRISFDSGTQTQKFFSIREGGEVKVATPGAVITAVRVGEPGYLRTLAAAEYIDLGDGSIRLRSGYAWPPLNEDMYYTRDLTLVEVDFTPPTSVPRSLRDGTAKLAAFFWKRDGGGQFAGALESERIGDYSYKLADSAMGSDAIDDLKADAMELLRPFTGGRVSVT